MRETQAARFLRERGVRIVAQKQDPAAKPSDVRAESDTSAGLGHVRPLRIGRPTKSGRGLLGARCAQLLRSSVSLIVSASADSTEGSQASRALAFLPASLWPRGDRQTKWAFTERLACRAGCSTSAISDPHPRTVRTRTPSRPGCSLPRL